MLLSRIILSLVNVVAALVGFLLLFRILLKFFGANPAAPFVSWIYDTSDALVAPFANIFPNTRIEGFFLDVSAIFALVVYAFIAYLIIEAIEIIAYSSEKRRVK